MFGYNLVTAMHSDVVLVSNESDALAVYQATNEQIPALVVPDLTTTQSDDWQRFPILAQIFKGFRLGEMTILTGNTGCGKSTFLSEYSLDLCEQNVSTLWCNLESSNSRLVSVMVQQYARKGFGPGDSEFDFWYNKLMSLPMYFTHIDSSTTNSIIINSLILTHGVQHVIVDNLQWMASLSGAEHSPQNEISARYNGDQRVDALCTYFQRLTREKQVHVTLVIHPEIENEETGVSFTALHGNELKAFQQADNVLVMQRKISRSKDNVREKCLQVWKNRFAGEVIYSDRLLMLFDSRTKCHRVVNRKFSRSD
uniref:SF4 helicase domain-containing protein n=1 Tax=Romanomermis culicivorax TaxID=13658 RepID=A0A915J307_ROMCU